jgi:membrane protein insertase Oxa1/YidC/SpoIIIJ
MSDDRSRLSGKSAFERGSDLFALPLAGTLTLFAGPAFYDLTAASISTYAASQFGEGWAALIWFLWMLGCAVGTFGFCLMLVAVTVKFGFAKIGKLIFGS